MSSKRALVVDDSKSARAFLSRILERHEIAVDAAESAEAAIEYLARNRPDVIFMDHMMPGMDGFQAVQSIKNNPRTCAIPILMYTSQEGDLYAGQARALGAEGVLPKQIKHSDVTKMLYQLRLVADRRGGEPTSILRMAEPRQLLPANEADIDAVSTLQPPVEAPVARDAHTVAVDFSSLLPKMSLEIRAALDSSIQKELTALRGFINASLDTQGDRLQHELVSALTPPPRAAEFDAPALVPERRSWPAILGWTVALLALAGAAALSRLWWQQGGELAALRTDLDAAYAEVEALRARPEVVSPPVAVAPPAELVPADPAAVVAAADAPGAILDGAPVRPVPAPVAESPAITENPTAESAADPPANPAQ